MVWNSVECVVEFFHTLVWLALLSLPVTDRYGRLSASVSGRCPASGVRTNLYGLIRMSVGLYVIMFQLVV